MTFDLIFRDARLPGGERRDLGVLDGRFAAVEAELPREAGPEVACGGRLAVPGLVESHIHLDKSCLTGRCACRTGTLAEAVREVAAAKRSFTEADVYARAQQTLERAILHGTTRMRTHVEVDPRIGLTSLHALLRLKRDYAWAVDLTLCAFPQEGLLDDPGCEQVLVAALDAGVDLVGGAPYQDRDAHGQIARIFALAKRFDVDVDLHLDFSLDPASLDLFEVCRWTEALGWGGRVAVGHVTKLSALGADALHDAGRRMEQAGVALTVLPATDLFLAARGAEGRAPRGVAPVEALLDLGGNGSLATNNVLNPFTPLGDASLLRIANLYANVAQLGTSERLAECFSLVTERPARLMRLAGYGFKPGNPADLVLLDAETPAEAVASLSPALFGYKNGRRTFERPRPVLHRPG